MESYDAIDRAYQQKNTQILKNVEKYKSIIKRDGYLRIPISNHFEEDELLKTVSLLQKDGEIIANRRKETLIWDCYLNGSFQITESIIKTNISVRKTNFWMKYLTATMTIMSLITLLKQCTQDNQNKLKDSLLLKQMTSQDSLQRISQMRLDSFAKAQKSTYLDSSLTK